MSATSDHLYVEVLVSALTVRLAIFLESSKRAAVRSMIKSLSPPLYNVTGLAYFCI